MKILLSNQEFADLLLLAAIGERVICNDTLLTHYDQRQKRVEKLLSTLSSYAPSFGMGDQVESDGEDGRNPTEEYYQEIFELLDEYEQHQSWEVMSGLLAHRDLAREYEESKWEKLPVEERREISFRKRMKYLGEFEEHGVERLFVRD